MPLFQKAVFHTTVANLRDMPFDAAFEVAFVGRSNAGKSSAINTLVGRTRLAFVSKTPGRTQHLNYFLLEPGKYMVDLPGYGFAKAPEEIRGQWEWLIGPYLQSRASLRGLVLIMDSRHPLTPLDRQMIDWFLPSGKPIHVLLSKADKLTRQEQIKTLREVKAALAQIGPHLSAQLFSSLKKTGVEDAEAVLGGWMEMSLPEKKPKEAPAAKAASGKGASGKGGAGKSAAGKHAAGKRTPPARKKEVGGETAQPAVTENKKPPEKGETGGENAST